MCEVCEDYQYNENTIECSECGKEICIDCLDKNCNFCPKCGKDLDGLVKEVVS